MVKVRALKGCKFGYKGQRFVFKLGEEREIDVPINRINERSFEILEKGEKKVVKMNKKIINGGGE